MQHKSRFIVLAIVLSVLALAIGPANAQAQHGPEVAACLPGADYAPGCDVDQNGVIDIVDVQRTASRWNSSGVYTSGHDHFGEFWTGVHNGPGLEIRNGGASGNAVGIMGLTTEDGTVGVWGEAAAFAGTTYGIYGRTVSTSGTGVHGLSLAPGGTTYGVYGESWSQSGTGVHGLASSLIGTTYGVRGESTSQSGTGVYGSANSGTGVLGSTFFGTGMHGRASLAGTGVFGEAAAASGATYGMHGRSASTSGTGVYGEATAASGGANGVRGESDSTSGAGVFGRANAATGGAYGVAGHSSSASGRGVFGWATATSGTTYGVYGRSDSADGYSGYFLGRLHATGTLSKGGGSFKIDHPLNPADKYLYHSFVESPDMMNVYNGNVTTGEAGFATVVLPDYFEALNRDYRYQLTVIGQFAQAIVADEVQGNQFRIQTDQPGVKVSWQVTGIRQDAWANANRIQVEQDKPGLFLHPEALGQPANLGVDYARDVLPAERTEAEEPPVR